MIAAPNMIAAPTPLISSLAALRSIAGLCCSSVTSGNLITMISVKHNLYVGNKPHGISVNLGL